MRLEFGARFYSEWQVAEVGRRRLAKTDDFNGRQDSHQSNMACPGSPERVFANRARIRGAIWSDWRPIGFDIFVISPCKSTRSMSHSDLSLIGRSGGSIRV